MAKAHTTAAVNSENTPGVRPEIEVTATTAMNWADGTLIQALGPTMLRAVGGADVGPGRDVWIQLITLTSGESGTVVASLRVTKTRVSGRRAAAVLAAIRALGMHTVT